jgi:hypothetical protein
MNELDVYRKVEVVHVEECKSCEKHNRQRELTKQAVKAIVKRVPLSGMAVLVCYPYLYWFWKAFIWFVTTYPENRGANGLIGAFWFIASMVFTVGCAWFSACGVKLFINSKKNKRLLESFERHNNNA